jgi:hypothetical protein
MDGVVKLLNALNPPKPKKQVEKPKEVEKPQAAQTETVVPQEEKLKIEETKPSVKQ